MYMRGILASSGRVCRATTLSSLRSVLGVAPGRSPVAITALQQQCTATNTWQRGLYSSQKQASQKNAAAANNKENDASSTYGKTLNLPETNFPMRANLAQREPELQKFCTDHVYMWQQQHNKGEDFTLHDGPPYANGKLHIGHALNKILKDIVNRYKVLRGHRVNYIPGWDCHGLPIEIKAITDKGKDQLTPIQIRKKARDFALQTIEEQKAEFKRWGVMGDWDNAYKTLDPEYEAHQLEIFLHMYNKGYIYRGVRPVYWSPSSKTALAEAELEYPESHTSKSAYVLFPVTKGGDLLTRFPNLNAVIWTTTPWTIPANQAICYGKDIVYCIVSDGAGKHLIVAEELLEQLRQKTGMPLPVVTTVKGSELEGFSCKHPLDLARPYGTPFIAGDHVTTTVGTGLVHTAPGHGLDDFHVWNETHAKNNSPPEQSQILCPVNGDGVFTPDVGIPELVGKSVLGDGNLAVIEMLKAKGQLLKVEDYNHKYPYDWRTKKPVITRATSQWFAQLSGLKETAKQSLFEVKMVPPVGRARLESMLEGRAEWCISRQRVWGVPIPVFYDRATDKPLCTPESVSHVIELVRKHGTDCWWTMPVEELLAPKYRNDGNEYVKGQDTLDVWFDSGSSWNSVIRARGQKFPVDLYLEGSDQHRGWFQSSLLTSVATTGGPPYLGLVTHGFVLDHMGRKMSKSEGNVIEPSQIIYGGKDQKKEPALGADVLRLWVASSDYSRDVLIGTEMLGKQAELSRKIRNTARFMLGNLSDFYSSKDYVKYEDLLAVDKYMLHKLHEFCEHVTQSYDAYAFSKVHNAACNFAILDLSSFYFEVTKDRLYAEGPKSLKRRSAQTVLYEALQVLTKSIAPIMCHTAEDIYQHFPAHEKKNYSVFSEGWFKNEEKWNQPAVNEQWETLKALRSEINRLLEKARSEKALGSSLEACVEVHMESVPRLQQFLAPLSEYELSELFNVSSVETFTSIPAAAATTTTTTTTTTGAYDMLIQGKQSFPELIDTENGRLFLRVMLKSQSKRHDHHKCPRCWKYTSPKEDALCSRCDDVLAEYPDLAAKITATATATASKAN